MAPKLTPRKSQYLPAVIAVGGSLATLPAAALELGELKVQSHLGQPLRASIAYALSANEQLASSCITTIGGNSGLPGVGPATVQLTRSTITITGRLPVREPMAAINLAIRCPYAPNLSREFQFFLDPQVYEQRYEAAAVTAQAAATSIRTEVAADVVAAPVTAVRPTPTTKDISVSTRYQVQPGETLSQIVQRIQNRPVGLWPAVNAVFEANPDAFENNDPNRLKTFAWLAIPSFDGTSEVVVTPEAEVSIAANTAYEAAFQAPVEEPIFDTPIVEPDLAREPVALEGPVATQAVVLDELGDTDVATAELQPGDVIFSTQADEPVVSSGSADVPTAVIKTGDAVNDGSASFAWMSWLIASAVALFAGLYMYGRRFRSKPGATPIGQVATEHPLRRFGEAQEHDTESVESLGIDYEIADDSPTEENLALDANLEIGSGLSQGSAQSFDFADTTRVDFDLPVTESEYAIEATDMLPPLRAVEESILDSEVLPEDEDDEYDMSVVIDATKMPPMDDVTERDLKAVAVTAEDTEINSGAYTINQEIDFDALEQDYEDELSATQALNQEIARAALALEDDIDGDADETAALPGIELDDFEATAQLQAQNDDVSNLDGEETIEMQLDTERSA